MGSCSQRHSLKLPSFLTEKMNKNFEEDMNRFDKVRLGSRWDVLDDQEEKRNWQKGDLS